MNLRFAIWQDSTSFHLRLWYLLNYMRTRGTGCRINCGEALIKVNLKEWVSYTHNKEKANTILGKLRRETIECWRKHDEKSMTSLKLRYLRRMWGQKTNKYTLCTRETLWGNHSIYPVKPQQIKVHSYENNVNNNLMRFNLLSEDCSNQSRQNLPNDCRAGIEQTSLYVGCSHYNIKWDGKDMLHRSQSFLKTSCKILNIWIFRGMMLIWHADTGSFGIIDLNAIESYMNWLILRSTEFAKCSFANISIKNFTFFNWCGPWNECAVLEIDVLHHFFSFKRIFVNGFWRDSKYFLSQPKSTTRANFPWLRSESESSHDQCREGQEKEVEIKKILTTLSQQNKCVLGSHLISAESFPSE